MYKLIRNFFWFCAGANKRILEEYDIDHNKYFAIGATIFFTAIFAGLSGGYAMYFVFSGSAYANIIAGLFGLLWGLMIFNIDRFLVLSIKKENKPLKEFFFVFPRLVLAIMIGVVIARPLELRIFEKEINEGLKTFYIDNQAEIINSKFANFDTEIQSDLLILEQKRIELLNETKIYNDKNELFEQETNGLVYNGRTSGKAGYGPLAKERQRQLLIKEGTIRNLEANIKDLEKIIKEKRKNAGLDNVTALDNKTLDSLVANSGFYDRNKILGQISSWSPFDSNKTDELSEQENSAIVESNIVENDSISNANSNLITTQPTRVTQSRFDGKEDATVFFISLLFIIIEILPILVKIMSSRSNYDELLRDENDRIQFIKRYERTSHRELVKSMALSQREVLKEAIKRWEEEELKDENLNGKYINSNNNTDEE
jgi:hypothetical protein